MEDRITKLVMTTNSMKKSTEKAIQNMKRSTGDITHSLPQQQMMLDSENIKKFVICVCKVFVG
jgi:hypothetical protein